MDFKNMKFFSILALAVAALGLSACENTWSGAGQDMEEAGEEMQNDYDGNNY